MTFVLSFLLRRLSQGLVIVLLVGFVNFSLLRIVPGDPVRIVVGPMATEKQVEEIATELGLDDPLPIQFGRYLSQIAKGDFGNSFIKAKGGNAASGGTENADVERAAVIDLIKDAIPLSALLAALGVFFALIFSIPLGIAAGLMPNGIISKLTFAISSVFVSLPNIWLAILLILVISTQLGWLPAIGYKGASYAILPAIVLAVELSAVIVRALASSITTSLQENFVQAGVVLGLL